MDRFLSGEVLKCALDTPWGASSTNGWAEKQTRSPDSGWCEPESNLRVVLWQSSCVAWSYRSQYLIAFGRVGCSWTSTRRTLLPTHTSKTFSTKQRPGWRQLSWYSPRTITESVGCHFQHIGANYVGPTVFHERKSMIDRAFERQRVLSEFLLLR